MQRLTAPRQTPLGPLYLIDGDIVSETLAGGQHWDDHVYLALEPYLRPGETVLDVGANVGAHTLRFSRAGCRVIAFEVNPDMRHALLRNVWNEETVQVRGGLYSGPARLKCREQVGNSLSSLAWVPSFEEGQDAGPFWTDEKVCAIKVDAQGADLHCLQGVEGAIRASRPAIVFEWEEDLSALHGHTWRDYEVFLRSIGYRWELVKNSHQDFLAVGEERE